MSDGIKECRDKVERFINEYVQAHARTHTHTHAHTRTHAHAHTQTHTQMFKVGGRSKDEMRLCQRQIKNNS